MSEVFELKNTWFLYNKKINSVLVILPQEILNRYDMVAKSLQAPVFDMAKYPSDQKFIEIFDEITYKMAQYYFSIFQAIFSKDNESVRPMISDFLSIQDPMHRSRKIISYFEELHGIIDKKLYYVQKMADEFKERSKTVCLSMLISACLRTPSNRTRASTRRSSTPWSTWMSRRERLCRRRLISLMLRTIQRLRARFNSLTKYSVCLGTSRKIPSGTFNTQLRFSTRLTTA